MAPAATRMGTRPSKQGKPVRTSQPGSPGLNLCPPRGTLRERSPLSLAPHCRDPSQVLWRPLWFPKKSKPEHRVLEGTVALCGDRHRSDDIRGWTWHLHHHPRMVKALLDLLVTPMSGLRCWWPPGSQTSRLPAEKNMPSSPQ